MFKEFFFILKIIIMIKIKMKAFMILWFIKF